MTELRAKQGFTAHLTGDVLAVHEAIRQQLYCYCRAVDRLDTILGSAVWHEDGIADYGSLFQGSGRDFMHWVCERHRIRIAHSHQIANVLIVANGASATSEAYVTAVLRHREAADLIETTIRGRYLDAWSLRNDRWAIDRRTYVHDFDACMIVSAIQIEGWGRHGTGDPSCGLSGFRLEPD